MTKAELRKLRKSLPKGWAATLAKRFNHSVGHINAVLNGNRVNIFVLKAALEMAEEWKKEQELLKYKIKKI